MSDHEIYQPFWTHIPPPQFPPSIQNRSQQTEIPEPAKTAHQKDNMDITTEHEANQTPGQMPMHSSIHSAEKLKKLMETPASTTNPMECDLDDKKTNPCHSSEGRHSKFDK